ncbi:hypothetical protein [Diaminobutyricimonas aerilata]|uniref:primosomal protein N' family DNA-binding protein n=1 Tax=Diaminobutyricimonas aerilata TaxID=1162967 RepID=UPI000C237585|nr:hypothetical protein [Diaminobutyricimonas aerilata]
MASASIARVLIDSPLPQLDRLFDYRIPPELAADAQPGVRVRVPLRSAGRVADGWIVELTDSVDYTGELSLLESVVSPVPVLTPEVWTLARKVADRAAGSASDVVRLAVPRRYVRVEKAWLAAPPAPAPPVSPVDPAGYRAELVEAIESGGRVALDAVPRLARVSTGWVGRWATTFAALATHALARGTSAILAVPDHRDQNQVLGALAEVLPPERIVHLDARQPDAERYGKFLRCLGDEPLVIVGNRSVVYAPARRLGLIALWDDGDPLFAEQLAPYVHARDAALLRQEQQGAALVLAGHTRSSEAERLVQLGWLTSVSPERIESPRVVLTALQAPDDRLAAQARIPSSAWRSAREGLDSGPVLVQVARPGYATHLVCADCGEQARCRRCDGPLTTKSATATPSCAWCGALAAAWRCPHCEGAKFRRVGAGSVRTAEDLGRAFPGAKVLVADGEHQRLTVPDKPALVIATRGAEPIADGGYRAVLLLDGERMVARESLRVGEDCLRWWSDAAALAAPGAPVVLVGVAGALASALATWRQADYARQELADRRRLRFPPAIRTATVTGQVDAVSKALEPVRDSVIDVLGPVDVEGGVRAIVRFDYAHGPAVASALRAEVIRAATARRAALARRAAGAAPALRVRFDDPEPFD